VFYVFYEQYLTIWSDTLQSLGLSLAAVFVVTLLLTGFNVFSALIVLLMVAMVVVNLGGLMYWWNVSLNAVSLVNLVMVSDVTVPQPSHSYSWKSYRVPQPPNCFFSGDEATVNCYL
jgi:Niemann-Pick C1 protein